MQEREDLQLSQKSLRLKESRLARNVGAQFFGGAARRDKRKNAEGSSENAGRWRGGNLEEGEGIYNYSCPEIPQVL